MPNSSEVGMEQAFSIYGILLLPKLIGGIILYYIFELRGIYFLIALALLFILMLNIYFYYKRILWKEHQLKLIVDSNYLRLMDNKNIYMSAHIKEIKTRKIITGKKNYPAISIKSEGFDEILIGLKKQQNTLDSEQSTSICQPDYWLIKGEEWKTLSGQLFRNIQ